MKIKLIRKVSHWRRFTIPIKIYFNTCITPIEFPLILLHFMTDQQHYLMTRQSLSFFSLKELLLFSTNRRIFFLTLRTSFEMKHFNTQEPEKKISKVLIKQEAVSNTLKNDCRS